MRSRPRLALVLALAALGCATRAAEGEGAGTPPGGWILEYQLSGGIAGFDVTFTVDGEGRARYERRSPRPEVRTLDLPEAETRALLAEIRESGYLDLAPRHAPAVAVSDGFTYRFRFRAAALDKEVVAEDGAVLPAALVRLRERVGALERKVIQEGRKENGS